MNAGMHQHTNMVFPWEDQKTLRLPACPACQRVTQDQWRKGNTYQIQRIIYRLKLYLK